MPDLNARSCATRAANKVPYTTRSHNGKTTFIVYFIASIHGSQERQGVRVSAAIEDQRYVLQPVQHKWSGIRLQV